MKRSFPCMKFFVKLSLSFNKKTFYNKKKVYNVKDVKSTNVWNI